MAINIGATYPAQTDVDPAYPSGKPKNRTANTPGTGFPFDELWLQDLFGMLQAMDQYLNVTLSGSTDTADVSQRFSSVLEIAGAIGVYPGSINFLPDKFFGRTRSATFVSDGNFVVPDDV